MKVYILRQAGTNLWKIGRTSGEVDKRVASLQTGNPASLEVYAVLNGDKGLEKRVHKELRRQRKKGGGVEWFEMYETEAMRIVALFGG